MLDIKLLRDNPDLIRENIRKKFQDHKLPLVDEVIALDEELRAAIKEANDLRASRNALSKQIGMLMGQGKRDEAEEIKAQVSAQAEELADLQKKEGELQAKLNKKLEECVEPNYPKDNSGVYIKSLKEDGYFGDKTLAVVKYFCDGNEEVTKEMFNTL